MDRPNSHLSRFAGLILVHVIAYVAIAIAIRILLKTISVLEVAALRSLGSILIASVLLVWNRSHIIATLKRATLKDVWRSIIHLAASLLLIWSLAELPLAYVAATEFSGPLFAAIILFAIARKKPAPLSLAGLGLIGVGAFMMLVSQRQADGFEVFIPFLAVFFLTVSNLLLADLAKGRSVTSIILTMHAIQLPVYLLLVSVMTPWTDRLVAFRALDVQSLAIAFGVVIILAVAGFATQAALAKASRHATPLQLCAADVLRIPAVGFAAYVAFGEVLSLQTILCSLVVVAGAVLASWPAQQREGVIKV